MTTADLSSSDANPVVIVALGASAGGLEAFKTFFHEMPDNSGLAFVLIQHLAPHHNSLTAEILNNDTTMDVVQVNEPVPVAANRVYVIPPNAYLTIQDSVLHLDKPVLQHGLRMPIDYFFFALAKDQHERAIAIVLSGTGSDGAMGVRAIKAAGGITFAQTPVTAAFNGMSQAAIATGMVDDIVAVEAMPKRLLAYSQHPYVQAPEKAVEAPENHLLAILELLRAHTGNDLRNYKEDTLLRRINRRIGLKQLTALSDYLALLREDEDELNRLAEDMLISVTEFFRDPDVFAELNKKALRPLLQAKGKDAPIRVWVPGCASGEEAYSIGMLLSEQIEAARQHNLVQIFATDIDSSALNIGRAGLYSEASLAKLSAKRVAQFFQQQDHHYRVSHPLREMVTFARQNLIADPPFSKLDLISCRNLLIYIKPEIQKQIIALFHFTLNPDGYLLLGSAETVGTKADLFRLINKRQRLFQRNVCPGVSPIELPFIIKASAEDGKSRPAPVTPRDGGRRLGELAQQQLLEDYAPATVLVNREYQILYHYGSTDRYLKQPTGAPTDQLLAQAREGLLAPLQHALLQAQSAQQPVPVIFKNAQVKHENAYHRIQIIVKLLNMPNAAGGLSLVSFVEQAALSVDDAAKNKDQSPIDEPLVKQLEAELRLTKNQLRAALEEQEMSNEELKAANEEATSVNEELQTTNEELETAKEELQSVNEELTTVNSQLQEKIHSLTAVNDDLTNLLSSVDIATMFLDRELNIKRFTPATRLLYKLISTDIKRPLGDITANVADPDLLVDAKSVLATLAPKSAEVRASENWYLRRVLPYRTQDEHIDGVVVTYVDITERCQAEAQQRRLAAVVRDASDAIMLLDLGAHILAWNRGAERTYGWSEQSALTMTLFDLIPKSQRVATEAMFARLARDERVAPFDTQRLTRDGSTLDVALTATPLRDERGKFTVIATTEHDITQRKQNEMALHKAKEAAEAANTAKSRFLAAASHDLRQPLQTLTTLNAVMKRSGNDEQLQNLINKQTETLTVMQDMLNIYLDINQFEGGAIIPKSENVALVDLFASLNAEFIQLAEKKKLTWRIRPCGLTVRSDPALLKELLRNLIGNAIKYTAHGKVLLGCRRRGAQVNIEVWDTGVGIADERLAHIFEEFYQLNNPARDRNNGLGLGLSIVDRLAKLLDHPIEVRSIPGKGSLFAVKVPCANATNTNTNTNTLATTAAMLLYIENEASIRDAITTLLELNGLRVIQAASGAEALAQVCDQGIRPDLILTDYRLPNEQTGINVAQQLRRLLNNAELPVILITGDIANPDLKKSSLSSHEQILHKPVESKLLLETIRALLPSPSSASG